MSDIEDMAEFNQQTRQHDMRGRILQGSVAPKSSDLPELKVIVNSKMWAVYGDRNFSPCEKAVPYLPAGQYTIDTSEQLGIFFRKADVNLDDLIELPDSASEQIIKEIEAFWCKEDHFRKFGFLWKRGILMWGPPGSGKTSIVQVISQRIVARDGIAIYVDNPSIAAKGIKLLRQVEPKRPIVMMLEDIDAIIERYGESDLLALMDGELQIDNVIFVATTNYPERLDKRFINRPSRFDIIKKVGMPNSAAREIYIKSKNARLSSPLAQHELMQWVELTKNFSIAHMKELIVSVEAFEVPLDQAVARLKTMMEYSPKSQDGENRSALGFSID